MKPEAKKMLERALALKGEAQTKRLYHDWANTYDETMIDGLGYLSPKKAAGILAEFTNEKNAKILDVGVGTGLVGNELVAVGFSNIDGIDYSAQMLATAKTKGIYQSLLEADLNADLEIKSQTYDALICVGVFTHGHVKANCLEVLFRLLKPEGKFVAAIRKDYWHSAGFDQKVKELTNLGTIRTLRSFEETNYLDSTEAESRFVVWEKI